jgi:hypothetical protein
VNEAIAFATSTLVPLLGSVSTLIENIASGARTLATAKAELASILSVAGQRLAQAEATLAAQDAAEDARVTPTAKK